MRNTKQTLPTWREPWRSTNRWSACYTCLVAGSSLLGVGVLSGCQSGGGAEGQSSPQAKRDIDPNIYEDPWVIATTDKDHPTPAYLSNGLIGLRFGRSGLSMGTPGTAFSLGQVSRDGEEKLLPDRNPMGALISIDGKPLDWGQISDYRQSLDFKTGTLETQYNLAVGAKKVEFRVVNNLNPTEASAIQRIEIGGSAEVGVTVDFTFAQRGQIPEIQTDSQQGVNIADGRATIDKASPRPIALTRREKIGGVQWTINSVEQFETTKQEHAPDIEIDGPVEDQLAVRSFLYYLKSSVAPDSKDGRGQLGPMGLSSQTYNGHVFWDADVWIFPALALLYDSQAATIPAYRIAKAEAAERNFKEARSWHRNKPDPAALATIDALQYPWESSVSGLEVSPTETKQQHHITGTVLFGLSKAAALGLVDTEAVKRIGKKAANFYRWRAELPSGSSGWRIRNVVSPDEFKFGDNDRYTNAVAEWTIRTYGGVPDFTFWRPFDPKSGNPQNYEGDSGRGYKQAAGVLAIYPLQDPETEKVARKMMDLYADKVIKNGPAMTDSVHATIWARLGEPEKAYETWRSSWRDFTKHPLLLFSEKRSKDETYFLTGAGGSLQTVLYGFLGFRLDLKKQPGAAWSTPLKNGYWLSVKPNLPKAWKKVTLKNFRVLGESYTLIASHEEVRVIPGE